MSKQSRLMMSSSSSQNTYTSTPEIGSSRVRKSQSQPKKTKKPQRGMGVEKLEKLRMEECYRKMFEENNLLPPPPPPPPPSPPLSNNSIINSPFQNSQAHHNIRSPSPLRNTIQNFSRNNSPSEYIQNFSRNNNSQPHHFQSSLNKIRTTSPLQRTQSSQRNIPNSLRIQTASNNPSRSVIDPARVSSGLVAPDRVRVDPFGYVGVGTVVQTSNTLSSMLCDLCIKKQRISEENAVLNVVEDRTNGYDSLRLGVGNHGQYANNNLGGSVMTHAGLIAAQQDEAQIIDAYKGKEIVWEYEFIPGQGRKGIVILNEAPPRWNFGNAAASPLVSPTTPNSSITTFHSDETNSAADTIDLTLKLSI